MGDGILSTVGGTPLVALTRVLGDIHFQLFAKLEALNPGGSIKDRPAVAIIRTALENGKICPDTVVIESSSGNMGIGLAQACAYFKLQFICVVDPRTTRQNVAILKSYGAQIDLVSHPDPKTGEFLPARVERVRQLLCTHRNSFWPNQYANINNARAHYQTMGEIVTALDGRVDYLFCAVSTCGTIRGCAEYVRDRNLDVKVFAVDAINSVIFGGKPGKRYIPGHGAAIVPPLHRPEVVDGCIHVSDLDCVIGCRRLVRTEAILAGGSSGGVLMAADAVKDSIPDGSSCVLIFADRGERYLDSIYSDAWVEDHFGALPELE